ncbi:unnamed protein product [Amaranthus hypochondriacus]
MAQNQKLILMAVLTLLISATTYISEAISINPENCSNLVNKLRSNQFIREQLPKGDSEGTIQLILFLLSGQDFTDLTNQCLSEDFSELNDDCTHKIGEVFFDLVKVPENAVNQEPIEEIIAKKNVTNCELPAKPKPLFVDPKECSNLVNKLRNDQRISESLPKDNPQNTNTAQLVVNLLAGNDFADLRNKCLENFSTLSQECQNRLGNAFVQKVDSPQDDVRQEQFFNFLNDINTSNPCT